MSAIAEIYAKKVSNGSRTIDSVPDTVLAEVKAILGIQDEAAEDIEDIEDTETNEAEISDAEGTHE